MNVSTGMKPRSRRALLATAASAAGAAIVSGCGTKSLSKKIRNGATVPRDDVAALNRLIDVENYGIAAYAAGIPLLGVSAAAGAAKQFLSQDIAHAVDLTQLVRGAGGKPDRAAATYNLGDPRTAAEALALLEHAERAQVQAYLEVIPTLSGGRIRAVIATIFANDAQHLAVLRMEAGQPPVVGAFTVG